MLTLGGRTRRLLIQRHDVRAKAVTSYRYIQKSITGPHLGGLEAELFRRESFCSDDPLIPSRIHRRLAVPRQCCLRRLRQPRAGGEQLQGPVHFSDRLRKEATRARKTRKQKQKQKQKRRDFGKCLLAEAPYILNISIRVVEAFWTSSAHTVGWRSLVVDSVI